MSHFLKITLPQVQLKNEADGLKWHYIKSFLVRSFSAPYFLAFKLNTEIYCVNLRIQSESKKIRTRKTPNKDAIYPVWDIPRTCHTSQERPLCKGYRSILSNCFQRVAQELLNADSAWKSLIVILKSPTFTCSCYLLILHKYSGTKLGANESATTFRKRFSAFKKCQDSRYPALASLGTQTKNGFEILITKNI